MSFDGLCVELQLIIAQQLFFDPRDCTALCIANLRFGQEAQRLLAQNQGPLFERGAVLMLVAERVVDPRDCASLCLAHPRIGLQLRRRFAHFKGPLVCAAVRLLLAEPGFSIDEPLLRRYAADAAFTRESCEWLRGDGSGLHLRVLTRFSGYHRIDDVVRLFNGEVEGAMVMSTWVIGIPGAVQHYEGERHNERLVRTVRPSGTVQHYEGERGAERLVRMEDFYKGKVDHYMIMYEGEWHFERLVRTVHPDGTVDHYEGERERLARLVHPDGTVEHYEGEPERLARIVHPDGTVAHYEGEQGAERRVRVEQPNGTVEHYKGERGAERLVRVKFSDGEVHHYDDAERLRYVEFPGDGWLALTMFCAIFCAVLAALL